ncbi:MAG: MerR family transcriptional regulator [Trebonia sp.]
MREGMRVGELAERAGLSAPTVRFYERAGLLAPPRRSEAGYRLYEPEALECLRFIVRAKGLGLSLEQIRLLRAEPDAESERRQLRHLVAHQLVRTRRQRRELEALEEALARLFGALAHRPGPGARPGRSPGPGLPELAAAAELADETARIETAACRCTCALDPGCTCGCPCCTPDEPAGAKAAGLTDQKGA